MNSYLSLDLRSLAVWRMLLGAVVLLDIVLRARDLQAFYGDNGMLNGELCATQWWAQESFQPFLAAGSTWQLSVLFGAWGAAALCLMVGYHTRVAGFLTWAFVVGIQLRNPMVLHGGDEILRLLLFWTPFLPLGARWSVDAQEHPEWASLDNCYRSPATVALYLQIAVFYFFAGLLKTGDDWLLSGDALYYALSIDQFTTGLGRSLLAYPDLLRPLGTAALLLEFLLPVLLLAPSRWTWARVTFLTLALGFHLAIAALFHFGLFVPMVLAGLSAFLPRALWPQTESSQAEALPSTLPSGYRLQLVGRAFSIFICGYILYVNLYSLQGGHKLSPWAKAVALVTYEHQHWHFFAPNPFREDGFFRLEVETESGRKLDILELAPLVDGKPVLGSARFSNQRWRRWMQNLIQIDIVDNVEWRKATLDYLLQVWKHQNPEEIVKSARLVFVLELTPPPGKSSTLKAQVLAEL